jgi:hypothetical protein
VREWVRVVGEDGGRRRGERVVVEGGGRRWWERVVGGGGGRGWRGGERGKIGGWSNNHQAIIA